MARGSIKKLPSGHYRIRVEVPPDPETRKRRWHTETLRTKKLAEDRVNALLDQLATGTYVKASTEPLATYLLDHWLPFYRTSVRESTTVQVISRINRHLVPRLGTIPLNQLRTLHIEQMYAAMLREGLKASTVNAVHITLNSALIKAVQWELLPKNPAKGCAPGRGPKRPVALWTDEQQDHFFDSIRGTTLHVFIAIIVCTGMRRGECLALQWKDIDLDAGTIAIQRTVTTKLNGWGIGDPKSESSRRLNAIPDSLVTLLKAHRTEQDTRRAIHKHWPKENWVIENGKGDPIAPRTMQEHWTLAREACDLPPIRLHDLRHGAATRMLDAGIPLKVVSEHLGHSSITITADVYQHVTSEMARRAAVALDRTL